MGRDMDETYVYKTGHASGSRATQGVALSLLCYNITIQAGSSDSTCGTRDGQGSCFLVRSAP